MTISAEDKQKISLTPRQIKWLLNSLSMIMAPDWGRICVSPEDFEERSDEWQNTLVEVKTSLLNAMSEEEWISVDEKLPEDNEVVGDWFWVKRQNGSIELMYGTWHKWKTPHEFKWQDPYTVGDKEGLYVEYYNDITHWKSLIEPTCLRPEYEDEIELSRGENAKLREALGQTEHYVVFSDRGWSVMHLVSSCRPNLTECEIHKAMMEQDWQNVYREGKYKVWLNDEGYLRFEKSTDAPATGGQKNE